MKARKKELLEVNHTTILRSALSACGVVVGEFELNFILAMSEHLQKNDDLSIKSAITMYNEIAKALNDKKT